MKGLSVIFTVLLLFAADQLALRLKRAGALPSTTAPSRLTNMLSYTGTSLLGSEAARPLTETFE